MFWSATSCFRLFTASESLALSGCTQAGNSTPSGLFCSVDPLNRQVAPGIFELKLIGFSHTSTGNDSRPASTSCFEAWRASMWIFVCVSQRIMRLVCSSPGRRTIDTIPACLYDTFRSGRCWQVLYTAEPLLRYSRYHVSTDCCLISNLVTEIA